MLSNNPLKDVMPWYQDNVMALNEQARQQALDRQQQLTKPPGALGELEDIAIQLAAMQGKAEPQIDQIRIAVFAADHGITEEGISAFPQAVTAQMVENFVHGGAAISVLAKQIGADLIVVDMGVNGPPFSSEKILQRRIANGTANFINQPAMSASQCASALLAGKEIIDQLHNEGMQLFIAGEMGIGNTTSATALAACLTEQDVMQLTGPGTGLNQDGISHKARVIQTALDNAGVNRTDALACLAWFGGFEIAAMVGAYLRCAQRGVPVLVDGFISSVAAAYAVALNTASRDWKLFGHTSQEPGHAFILQHLQAKPLLSLGMRLGEGSGAAVAVSIVQSALLLHRNMATFSSAGVSGKNT